MSLCVRKQSGGTHRSNISCIMHIHFGNWGQQENQHQYANVFFDKFSNVLHPCHQLQNLKHKLFLAIRTSRVEIMNFIHFLFIIQRYHCSVTNLVE